MNLCSRLVQAAAAMGLTVLIMLVPGTGRAEPGSNPFNVLLGSWGGTGNYKLRDGTTERMKCNAYYTGGGSRLGMAIRCSSPNNKIEIRSKLTQSGGRITGSWEERTYNAEGSATGRATGNKLTLQISGAVTGTMSVTYTRTRQSVSISMEGTPLSSVNVTLSRS